MPKTSIDEYSYAAGPEHDVCLATEAFKRALMDPEAQPSAMEMRPHCAFNVGIAPALTKHPLA